MKLPLLALPAVLYSATAVYGYPTANIADLEPRELTSHSSILPRKDSKGGDGGNGGKGGNGQKPMSFDAVKIELAAKYKVKPAEHVDDLKVKWDLKNDCNKCKEKNEVEDEKDKSKCRKCKEGYKADPDHKKCIRDDGCAEDETKKGDKCEKCPEGHEANENGKECKKKGDDKDKDKDNNNGNGKQGKCPDGKILDPAQGGQDENTEKPTCISDDNKKCPKGKSAVSRRTGSEKAGGDDNNFDPEFDCLPDDDPDHKCEDKNTYDHRADGGDGKIKHTCRSTRKGKEDKESTYSKKVEEAKGKKGVEDKDKQNKKRRSRCGWCWAALAGIEATAFTQNDLKDLTQDELDGMVNMWPDDNIPDPQGEGDIPDHVVRIQRAIIASTDLDTAGGPWGAIGKLIGKLIAGGGGSVRSALKELKSGTRTASKEALEKAKSSKAVEKMTKQEGYLDCLASTSTAGFTKRGLTPEKNFEVQGISGNMRYTLDVDWSRQPDDSVKPQPEGTDDKQIWVRMSEDTDESGKALGSKTYPDSYIRDNRINYESCTAVGPALKKKVTDVDTKGGCCAYYGGDHCESDGLLFTMLNRQDGQLKGKDDNAISSYWCTFDEGCKGAPGL